MITPSPRVEALLIALAADAPYRDAILGDLAEEFAIRVEEQGVEQAQRWYRRQAWRTAPHLLRQWAQRLSSFDVAHLIGLTLLGNAVLGVVGDGIRAAIVMSYGVVIDNLPMMAHAWRDLIETGAVRPETVPIVGTVAVVAFGYLLARLSRRAPLGTCFVVGSAFSIMMVVAAFYSPSIDLWVRVAMPFVYGPATVLGGALCVLHLANRRSMHEVDARKA